MAYTFSRNIGSSFAIANNINETIYNNIISHRENLELSQYSKIINNLEGDVLPKVHEHIPSIDMVYIDFNYNDESININIEQYLQLLNDNAFVACSNLDPVTRARIINYEETNNKSTKKMMLVMSINNFEMYAKTNQSITRLIIIEFLKKKLEHLSNKLYNNENRIKSDTPSVLVGVLTYNHEKFIKQCIDGILIQEGNFHLKVVIINDCSTDNSHEIINKAINTNDKNNIEIKYINNNENKGMVENIKTIVNLAKDCDYLTFCDGDDYWLTSSRIESHINYLKGHPEVGVSFNKIQLYYNDINMISTIPIQDRLIERIYTCEELIYNNFIGNSSCSFYDGTLMSKIPDEFFDMYVGDWMLNIYCSTMSEIGYINQYMNVYRKHSEGVWTGLGTLNSLKQLLGWIDDYNKFTNFSFDEAFTNHRNRCLIKLEDQYSENLNLIIIDDLFPSTRSEFRYQEFTSYLKYIEGTKILTTGKSLSILDNENLSELLIYYKRKHPESSGKLSRFDGIWRPVKCKLLYFTSLSNAYSYLSIAEENKIPFVFTLYSDEGFSVNNKDSDELLKRVFASQCFRKVIVTQQNIYDYLIKNKFCSKEKIEFIFSADIPLEKFELEEKYPKKIIELYNFQTQIIPRIKLLTEEISNPN
jgi:glycosyltransferase involved in cell wall biosynthesis/16S rRNA G966 N2-methylase RsmD